MQDKNSHFIATPSWSIIHTVPESSCSFWSEDSTDVTLFGMRDNQKLIFLHFCQQAFVRCRYNALVASQTSTKNQPPFYSPTASSSVCTYRAWRFVHAYMYMYMAIRWRHAVWQNDWITFTSCAQSLFCAGTQHEVFSVAVWQDIFRTYKEVQSS